MTKRIVFALGFALLCSMCAMASEMSREAVVVLGLESKMMDGWLKGDSKPALSLADEQISYFHIMTNGRVDDKTELEKLYQQFEGRPLFDSYSMMDTRVQTSGKVSVLSYTLVTHNGSLERRWNVTEVYEQRKDGWKIIHSHFSQLNPPRQTE